MKSRLAVVVLVVLLVGSLPAGVGALEPVGAADSASTADFGSGSAPGESLASVGTSTESVAATSGSGDVLHRTTVLRHRPADSDRFEATLTLRVPDPVTELEITLQPEAIVESTTGFERTGERTYEWTESTDEPTIRYTMPADRTGDEGTVGSSSDGYTFVDTGDWGVVQVPDVSIRYSRTDPVGIEKSVRVDGPGATGGDIAFFGAVREHRRTVDGETFRLVVPEAATLRESPKAILSALAEASGRLDVGMRSDEVFIVAVPNDVDWGPPGLKYGRSDAWVVADQRLDTPNPVWFHEYVHVRQRFSNSNDDTAAEAKWLVEAQADYYAGLIALETGRTDFGDFSDLLERGERSRYADGVLVDRSTWDDPDTDYTRGALVYGEIDRRLRLATDGDRTLEDVFRALNAREGEITEADFLRLLEEYGGTDVRAMAERYTRTEATPEMWSRSQHGAAFDQPVAVFEYGLGTDSIEVGEREWPRWNSSTIGATGGENGDVIAVPVGESVSIPVTVDNVGDRDGTYDATLQVDGRVVDHEQGTLAPGEGTSHRLSWTPSKPGEYTVRVGSERLTAVVRSATSVTVSDLRLSSETIDPGESVTATATVESADDRPAAAVIAFRTAEGVVAERWVALRPGESTTVEAALQFDENGRYEIGVGEQTVTVRVGGGPAAALEKVPGFGVPAALVALVMAVSGALLARRC
ncbi:CARDB domain-containing protein [Natrinema sp. DC36]|uniref:CARDB domain-containing protein n=1 Tax=Natrinema sp. DC36 TaxID=2878680 RepID=UPI001CF041B0|nr:CARDB domain-containing protein [Natrinema sp. DC36]